jgi:AAA15 family ATPase/GTPase
VRCIWMQDFLSFSGPPALWLDPGLTVVTGPNGAGKSNLARSLDVARAVIAPHETPESARLDLYREAGFEGAAEFTVKLDVLFDQQWEQALVRTNVRAAYGTAGLDRARGPRTGSSRTTTAAPPGTRC